MAAGRVMRSSMMKARRWSWKRGSFRGLLCLYQNALIAYNVFYSILFLLYYNIYIYILHNIHLFIASLSSSLSESGQAREPPSASQALHDLVRAKMPGKLRKPAARPAQVPELRIDAEQRSASYRRSSLRHQPEVRRLNEPFAPDTDSLFIAGGDEQLGRVSQWP